MNSIQIERKKEKLEIFIKESPFIKPLFEESKQEANYALDLEGKFVKVNRACEKISGHRQDELIRFFYKDILVENHLENVHTKFHHAIKGAIQQYECTILTQNNNRVDLEVTNFSNYC